MPKSHNILTHDIITHEPYNPIRNSYPSTYTDGPKFVSYKDVISDDIIKACSHYTKLIGTVVERGSNSKGNMVYSELDGGQYKSVDLKIGCNDSRGQWSEDNASVIIPNGDTINTYLKAFNQAPIFTEIELAALETCFKEIGLKWIGKGPTKLDLSTYNKVG